MNDEIKRLLSGADPLLDSFDARTRFGALYRYAGQISRGELVCGRSQIFHNMHMHTFFSYNCLGWSPSHIALAAKLLGFRFAGQVDFDVVKGVDEFLAACRLLRIPAVSGMETRVYIPEMADAEINSPGEPGVSYHMALGFRSGKLPAEALPFAERLEQNALKRTKDIVARVNAHLGELQLDFEKDVLTVTPAGNPTERHCCSAYRMKADTQFGGREKALAFWNKALKTDEKTAAKIASSDAALEGTIRSALMKRGGPGYVQPGPDSFPTLKEMNAFAKACGAIPCICWLNGLTSGEKDPAKLLEFHIARGCEGVTVIPDRNWNIADPEKKAKSEDALKKILAEAKRLGLPVLAGTELNTPGQKLFDSFDVLPLALHLDDFLCGAEEITRRFGL